MFGKRVKQQNQWNKTLEKARYPAERPIAVKSDDDGFQCGHCGSKGSFKIDNLHKHLQQCEIASADIEQMKRCLENLYEVREKVE